MGLKKAETVAVAVTLLFAALTVGFRLGRDSVPARFSVRTAPAATAAASADLHGETGEAVGDLVNLNTATLEELCALPGIGESLARRVIAYREEHGPFARVEDITRVSGIGSAILDALWDRITVE